MGMVPLPPWHARHRLRARDATGWPFATYALLTIGGIGLLAQGLLIGEFRTWLGWVVLAADVVFLGAYLRFEDIPPFVFYVLLALVGLGVL